MRQGLRQLTLQDVLGGVITGILLTLSVPRENAWPLAWVGLVPLLWRAQDTSPARAFWIGWLAGVVFFGATLHWLAGTMVRYGSLHAVASYAVLALLVGYLGVYFALFASGAAWFQKHWPRGCLLLVPALWTALEWLRTHALTGFPWLLLGYSQHTVLPLIQVADFSGVYGVGFALVAVNTAGTALLTPRPQRGLVFPAVFAILVCGGVWGYGMWRLSDPAAAGPSLKVALVQGNIDQSRKWDPLFRETVWETYVRLTERAIREGSPDLVIWPETATPFYFGLDRQQTQRLLRAVRHWGVPLLFGSPTVASPGVLHNSAYLVASTGEVRGRYDKMHLVPFGEYVPLQRLLPFVRRMVVAIGDFRAGRHPVLLEHERGRLGTVICFEIIFPDLVRRVVREGAQLMVTLTNDAWFGRTAAPYQHFAMATLRAVENRVYVVRVANTGISGVIDPAGRILVSSGLFTEEVLQARVHLAPVRSGTFYTRYGDLFAWICLAAVLGAAAWSTPLFPRRRKRHAVAGRR